MATFTFNPSAAVSHIAANDFGIPSPWTQEPSASSFANIVADESILVDGDTITLTVKDGWQWQPVYNPASSYGYARTEITLTRQIGSIPFPAGQLTSIEWNGYYPTPLPEDVSGEYFVSPGQLHNSDNVGPPHYSYQTKSDTGVVNLEIHNLDGTLRERIPLMNIDDMMDAANPITFKQYFKSNSTAGSQDGSMTQEINGRYVWHEAGTENSINPGYEYSRFSIYDFTNALTSPSNPGRGNVFSMTTNFYQVVNL